MATVNFSSVTSFQEHFLNNNSLSFRTLTIQKPEKHLNPEALKKYREASDKLVPLNEAINLLVYPLCTHLKWDAAHEAVEKVDLTNRAITLKFNRTVSLTVQKSFRLDISLLYQSMVASQIFKVNVAPHRKIIVKEIPEYDQDQDFVETLEDHIMGFFTSKAPKTSTTSVSINFKQSTISWKDPECSSNEVAILSSEPMQISLREFVFGTIKEFKTWMAQNKSFKIPAGFSLQINDPKIGYIKGIYERVFKNIVPIHQFMLDQMMVSKGSTIVCDSQNLDVKTEEKTFTVKAINDLSIKTGNGEVCSNLKDLGESMLAEGTATFKLTAAQVLKIFDINSSELKNIEWHSKNLDARKACLNNVLKKREIKHYKWDIQGVDSISILGQLWDKRGLIIGSKTGLTINLIRSISPLK